MSTQMHTRVVPASEHRPDEYAEFINGYRAVQLLDETGRTRGELVWRLAAGHTAEITEFNILEREDRRQGWGTMLLESAIADMRAYFAGISKPLRRIYLFTDNRNEQARAFYEARGFRLEKKLDEFFWWDDALLYVRIVEDGASG